MYYAEVFLARFSAFFSAGVFSGFFFAFFLLSIPLLIYASLNRVDWVAMLFTAYLRKVAIGHVNFSDNRLLNQTFWSTKRQLAIICAMLMNYCALGRNFWPFLSKKREGD